MKAGILITNAILFGLVIYFTKHNGSDKSPILFAAGSLAIWVANFILCAILFILKKRQLALFVLKMLLAFIFLVFFSIVFTSLF